jgi:phosphoglycolate phosphatase-like HAD superfamily hydrolase
MGASNRRAVIKWVVFDLDMTLLDTFRGFYKAFVECVDEHGVAPPSSFELFLADYEENLLRTYTPRHVDPFMFWRRCWSIYMERKDFGQPIPGMIDALNELRREGRSTLVATGREIESSLIMRELEAIGVSINPLYSLGDLGRGTKMDLLKHIIRIHGIQPNQTAYITDTPHDALAGASVGFHPIGFASWTSRFRGARIARSAEEVIQAVHELDEAKD